MRTPNWNSSGLSVESMNQLSLADLLKQRVPLAPREAATLTLAVAREWDRLRTLRGPVALPDIGASLSTAAEKSRF